MSFDTAYHDYYILYILYTYYFKPEIAYEMFIMILNLKYVSSRVFL